MVFEKRDYNILFIMLTIFGLLGSIWFWGYIAGSNKPPEIITNDSIITRDSIIIDSVMVENTAIDNKIITIKHEYDKKVDIILNNSDSADYVFFSNYIRNYCRPTKDGESDICRARETEATSATVGTRDSQLEDN